MLRGGIPLGKFFGISVRLHWSWFVIFVLFTVLWANSYLPESYDNWSTATYWAVGAGISVLLFASVLAHELAHSLVAQAAGIRVQAITLFILGGVSQLHEEPKRPGVEFRMAIAGPGTSIILGGIFWGIYFATRYSSESLSELAFWSGYVNMGLAVFNMLPGFPLDGGRVLRSILWWRSGNLQRATRIAATIGRGFGYLFIFGGILLVLLDWRENLYSGLWIAAIGWILENAAAGSYQQVVLQDQLRGHKISDAMTRDCLAVSPGITIEELVNYHILASGRRCFPVVENGRALGLITMQNVKAVPREVRHRRTVMEAMIPMDKLKQVSPDEDLSTAMQLLTDEDVSQLLVVENNRIIGMVGRENLLSFIHTRAELRL
jgi:Zn-dependent protease/CBS domain-containing protein